LVKYYFIFIVLLLLLLLLLLIKYFFYYKKKKKKKKKKGYKTRIFNVGNKRRVAHLNYQQTKVPGTKHDANFFDPSNTEYSSERDLLALETLEELITWLKKGGNVGIHDATNSTKKRRELLMNRCRKEPNVITMFVESIWYLYALFYFNY